MLASAADIVEIDGIYYELSSGETKTATVISGTNKYSGEVVITEAVTYNEETYSVTSIGGMTFKKIGNRISSISYTGNSAFCNCTGLTSVTIPNSVTSIGDGAFWGCTGLTSLTIGSNVTSIGVMAFGHCSGLTSVFIPQSVTSIGNFAFYDCRDLVSINVETGNTEYDSRDNCNAIIETQSNTLLSGCKNTIIPSNVTSIADKAFYYCSDLTSVTIPNGVTSIGEDAFCFCSGLTSITIPNSVTFIGNLAFSDCSGLTSITIPNSVTSIGQYPFHACRGLTSIEVEGGNTKYDSRDNCNAIIETQSNTLMSGCKNTFIPNGVTSIGDYAFYASGLTSVTIPNSVTSIGNYAFWACGMTSITIPNSVTFIGALAFKYCNKLTSVTIPNSVTSIGSDVFNNCSKLTSVTIPNSVTSIGSCAFESCVSLKDVYCYAENVPETRASAFTYCNLDNVSLHVPAGSVDAYKVATPWSGFKEVVAIESKKTINVETAGTLSTLIPETEKYLIEDLTLTGNLNGTDIRLLRDMAGNNYKGEVTEGKLRILDLSGASIVEGGDPYLESSSIKTTVGATMFPIYGSKYSTSKDVISYYMFAGCNSLQSVKLPAGITSIHFNGFAYCINMESISIFDKVTYLEISAFQDCRKLASIRIPKSVTNISGGSFSGCDNLNSIIVEEGNPKYDSRDNCNAVIETEDNRLIIGCRATTIPNTVTAIGMQAFYGCQFTSISIPSSVKTIEYGAFDASALTSIIIPSTVESIGIQIFRQCNQLTSIVVESGNPNYDSRENCNAIIETTTNKLIATCGTTVVPSSVTALGEYTFTHWKEIPSNLLDNVKIICDNAFDNALFVSIIIPEGVEIIGKEAFRCCNVMKTISLPASLKTIGDDVFSICYNLTEVYSHNPNPSDISENVFNYQIWDSSTHEYVPFSQKATLYVPAGSKEKYQATAGWKEFTNIEEIDFVSVDSESITIGKSGKASYCGDQSLDFSFSEEVKAYIATGYDKDAEIIWLTRVKDVPAGVPVLIKGEAGKTYDVPVTDSQNSYYTNMFVGNTSGASIDIYEKSDDGSKVNYYLKDGTFRSVSGNAKIGNNKCYLQLPATFNAAVTGASQTVTVGQTGKVSFAAPVDLDFTNVDGLKAFTATGYDKSTKTIWLTRVMKVQRGEGVLLKGNPDTYEIPSSAAQSRYENMFVGNTSGATIEIHETSDDGSQTNYYLKDGTFRSVSVNATIKNNKCYLALPTSMVAAGASTRSSEADYKLDEPEMITLPIVRSIESDNDGTTNLTPALSEGEGDWYTLQGQRVAKPGKGLYIRNGKVVVIK